MGSSHGAPAASANDDDRVSVFVLLTPGGFGSNEVMKASHFHRAIRLAVRAHDGQDDPPGEPYILHPMRVMLSLPEADHDVRCVAILHDAVERGRLKLSDLRREKLPAKVI